MPISALSSVDLPEPLGPTMTSMLFGSSTKLTLSRILRPSSVITYSSRASNVTEPVSVNSTRVPL